MGIDKREPKSADESKTLRVGGYGGGDFNLTGLNPTEVDALYGAFTTGMNYVRLGEDGHVEYLSVYEPFPSPIHDEAQQPFWQPAGEEVDVQMELETLGRNEQSYEHNSPSLIIKSLCGYNYTPENYVKEAGQLVEYGFMQLRSERNEHTGQYLEMWYLPGLWCAKGELKMSLFSGEKLSGDAKVKRALDFLRKNCQFGTLDISVQRLAMPIPD